jgi:PhzF family phenazine biosynthesis protein
MQATRMLQNYDMTIPYFEVFAFTKKPFAGNPAGVCFLPNEWLADSLLQSIAAENGLPETAFLIDRGDYFDVRWMSPTVEIDLCGHATLAAAHVLFNHLGHKGDAIKFQYRSGELRVDRKDSRLVLDFPSQSASNCDPPKKLVQALRAQPRETLKGRDYFAIFEHEEGVAAIKPDLEMLTQLDAQGVVVTAPGKDCDFVSRYFAPAAGIPEDPVTGSTHCTLIPYWSKRLGKRELSARQISKRGGELFCEDRGERVGIGGHAMTYMEGKIRLE